MALPGGSCRGLKKSLSRKTMKNMRPPVVDFHGPFLTLGRRRIDGLMDYGGCWTGAGEGGGGVEMERWKLLATSEFEWR